MSWQGGRQLATMTDGGNTLRFAYNESGLRTEKTVNGVAHSYVWQGSKLAADITGEYALYFHYDSSGDVIGFTMAENGADTEYFYVKNLQGDVLSVISADGTEAAAYTYDAWGRVLTSTGNLADINPLRYRGYYYDVETGLYYLQSRYYDPEVSRFINPDSFATTDSDGVLSANMFAYCENKPVMRTDPTGTFFNTICGAIVGGIAAVVTRDADNESWQDAFLRGSVTGALAGLALDASIATGGVAAAVIAVGVGGIASGIDSYWEQKNVGKDVNYGKVFLDATIGAGMNGLFGAAGRVAKRAVGHSIKTVFQAIVRNTVDSVTTKSGNFLVSKFVKTTVQSFAESGTAATFGKMFSFIGAKTLIE